MGKKKRGPTLEELLARPWCYYCERDFDDLKILISHQKAKHFKCERCGRRLNTAGGLSVHMSQVHKEQLTEVDNALPNRSSLDVEIFGMEGVPEDIVQAHNQRVVTQFQQAEVERQAVTGNPPPGASTGGQPASKKPKFESPADLKKRLAEHKAKLAERLSGGSSGEATPLGAEQQAQQPSGGFTPPPSTAPATNYPQQYGTVTSPYHQTASPVYQTTFSPTGQPQYPPPAAPYSHTQPSFPPGPPAAAGYGATPSPYTPQPQAFGTQPPMQAQQQPTYPPRFGALPQRPVLGGPQINPQQMHPGQPGPPSELVPSTYDQSLASNGQALPGVISTGAVAQAVSADNLTPGSAKPAEEVVTIAKPAANAEEKPGKKDKSKAMKMVYSDNETSPEEKMARLPRYAFNPERKGEVVLGELPAAVVVGTIRESDTVIDTTR